MRIALKLNPEVMAFPPNPGRPEINWGGGRASEETGMERGAAPLLPYPPSSGNPEEPEEEEGLGKKVGRGQGASEVQTGGSQPLGLGLGSWIVANWSIQASCACSLSPASQAAGRLSNASRSGMGPGSGCPRSSLAVCRVVAAVYPAPKCSTDHITLGLL